MSSITRVKCEYWIAALAAVVLLGGCQSSGMAPQIPGGLPQNVSQTTTSAQPQAETELPVANTGATASNLAGERFSTSNISIHCTGGGHIFGENINFTATGAASGPYTGAFQASGSLGFNGNFYFNERFEIRSGSTTISGTASLRDNDIALNSCLGTDTSSFTVFANYNAQGTSGPTDVTYKLRSTPKFLQTFGSPSRKPTIVQTASGSTHATSASCTFAKAPTAGNVMIFGVGFYPLAVTITPPAGVTAINATNQQEHDYYRVVRAGDGRAWTFRGSGNPYIDVMCYEVTGEDASNPIDAHGENHTTAQVQRTVSVKPVTSGTLPIAFFGNGNRTAFTGLTSGWTNDINEIRGYKQFGTHGPLASLSSVQASITLTGGAASGGTALVLVRP